MQDVLSDNEEEVEIGGNADENVGGEADVEGSAPIVDVRKSTRIRRPPLHLQDYHLTIMSPNIHWLLFYLMPIYQRSSNDMPSTSSHNKSLIHMK
ncbi:hypothetical protein LINGRAHAP2_LOCUS2116, partial [Linum grandiflorum]